MPSMTTLTIQDIINKAKQYLAEGYSQEAAIRKAIDYSKLVNTQREISRLYKR